MTNAEARCNKSLRPRKPDGSLGRTAQDVHLDSHTAPELCILPSTTAVFSYAIRSRKLSAKEPFFVGAQTVVSLLQTTQGVSFTAAKKVYTSINKTTIV